MSIKATVASLAFMPPDPSTAIRVLSGNPHAAFVTSSLGHRISLVVFDRRAPTNDVTILYSHGNAEDLGHSYRFFDAIAANLHCRVVAYDYSGYGLSEGPLTEEAAIASANAVFDHIITGLGAPRNTVVLMGRSLGSGATTDLASRERGLKALVLCSALTSCVGVASRVAQALLPSSCDMFTNIDKIHLVTDYPVLIMHGTEDKVIDVGHGKRLFEKVRGVNSRVWARWVVGAGHNDMEETLAGEFWSLLMRLFAGSLDPSEPVIGEQQVTTSSWSSISTCS